MNNFAYISDACGDGGIVVYSYNDNMAWRFDDVSMHYNHPNFIINGVSCEFGPPRASWTHTHTHLPIPCAAVDHMNTPSDGIALSVDVATLYYSALASLDLWSIPTAFLRDPTLTDAQRHTHVHSTEAHIMPVRLV